MKTYDFDTFNAVMIAEGVQDATYEETMAAWQHLIDTGLCWQLQGWFGRSAHNLINAGLCTMGETA